MENNYLNKFSINIGASFMNKIINKSIFIIFISLLLTSCAGFHSGNIQNSASLSSKNFSYVKQNIYGSATATYVFFIGGLGKETLVHEAKKKMLQANPLRTNQALANITVNFKTSYFAFGLVSTVTCKITADLVEFY